MTNNRLPYKTKQFFFVLIKLSIVIGAFYFIYEKLTNNSELQLSVFVNFLVENHIFSSKNILFLLFLSILNWFFEIFKWKTLVSFIKKITFKNALEQCLAALTASLITPNRIGEYGAKAIFYNSLIRKQIVLINLLSNMLQMAITIVLGIIGLYFLATKYNLEIDYYKLARLITLVLLVLLVLGFGFKKSKIIIKGFSFKKIKLFFFSFPKNKLVYGFILSLIRYIIFSFQFYFLLQLLKVNINYFNAMTIITTMYLLASFIPSIFIFDVIIKGSVALYLFSFAGVNELTILSTTTIMWLLNFVTPSMFGSFYVLNFNFPKDKD